MADRLTELQEELREFVRERDWDRFHDPKNLAMLIASEAGELVAEYRWVHGADADAYASDPEARARVEAEAADVGIALLLLFDRVGVDPVDAMRTKLQVNRSNYPRSLVRGTADRPPRGDATP